MSSTSSKREAVSFDGWRAGRVDPLEQAQGLCDNEFLADPSRREIRNQRVQPTGGLVTGPRQLVCRRDNNRSTVAWSSTRTGTNSGARNATIATERASLGELPPVDRSRWLRGQVGLGLTVQLFPLDGWQVAEARVQPLVVVAVDPREDRTTCIGSGREPVAVHDFAFE